MKLFDMPICCHYLSYGADLAPIREHFEVCFSESYAEDLDPAALKSLLDSLKSNDVGGLLPSRDEKRLVVLDDKKIIGSAIWATRSNITYIWGGYVRRDYQRKGVGSAMMLEILDHKPAATVFELSVMQSSQDAVAFYLSKGFSVVSEGVYELVLGQEHPTIVMRVNASADPSL